MGKLIDLTGKNFGHWTVLERGTTKRSSSGTVVYWKCRCDCGTEKEVRGSDLKNGRSTSCGCTRKEGDKDLSNQRFGRLVAIEPVGKDKYNNILWKCLCDCGSEVNVLATLLRQGKTKSCGCLQRERTSEACKKDLTGLRFGKWTVIKETEGHILGQPTYWDCICDCGTKSSIDARNLTSGASQSCGCERSRGERLISMLLTENKLSFIKEKTFPDLLSEKGNRLRFDFFVENKYLIEYDGQQHYENEFDNLYSRPELKVHDAMKNKYCKDNHIPLIRIPYTHYKNLCIKDLLLETSDFLIK